MNLSRLIYKVESLRKETEFLIIFFWALFFPFKQSLLYFLSLSILIIVLLIVDFIRIKSIGISYFNHFLIIFNLFLILSIFFANDKAKAILLYSDIFLVSAYFFVFSQYKKDSAGFFTAMHYGILACSTLYLINHILLIGNTVNIFFENPILQGIVSGAGVVISLYTLVDKRNGYLLIPLVINLAATYMSGSKAAFLSLLIFTSLIAMLKMKKLLIAILLLTALTFLIPNPIKDMFQFSLTRDPYATNRLDIWAMTWHIFLDHPFAGIGLDNFPDVAKKYNFKQKHGPANYFKCPRMTHNDYLKLVAETGLLGLAVLLISLFFLIRRLLRPPLLDITKLLVLYLLFHGFLINILFNFLFLFWILFLVRILFDRYNQFIAFEKGSKWIITAFLLLIFLTGYLLPYLGENCIKRAGKSQHIITAFNLLKKAEHIDPLNSKIYYSQAIVLFNYFRERTNLEVFSSAVERLKKAQSLNTYFVEAYLLEFDLLLEAMRKNLKYPNLEKEMIDILQRAGEVSPYNPFIKLKKAGIYIEFNHYRAAQASAMQALALEPNYIAAHYFLYKNFPSRQNKEEFRKKILRLVALRDKIQPKPGSYLDELFLLPEELKQELEI